MEDSALFMQWAMDTLVQEEEPAVEDDVQWAMDTLVQEEEEQEPAAVDDGEAVVFPSLQALRDASHAAEMVRELMAVAAAAETHDAANSWSSGSGDGGEVTDGGSSGATEPAAPTAAAATDYYGGSSWPPQSPNSPFAHAPPPPPPSSNSNSNTILPTVSWNFVTGSAQPSSDGVLEEAAVPIPTLSSLPPELAHRRRSPPQRRRAHHPMRSMGAPSSVSCTPDHIVAERKRREKINKRLIELSTVIPGLKKMDKATILSDAAKYVKELQQRLKALEESAAGAGAGSIRSKAPPPTDENNGGSQSPASASSSSGAPTALPEIEARFSERSVMVRIHCGDGKGVAAAALTVVEGLGLTVVHANVMPFSACTIVMTITAEMEGRLILTTEQIVGKLKSALSHQPSISCQDDAEEIET